LVACLVDRWELNSAAEMVCLTADLKAELMAEMLAGMMVGLSVYG
jgi:hypothetical protein